MEVKNTFSQYSSIQTQRTNNSKPNINFKGHSLVQILKDPNYSELQHYVYKLTNGQTVIISPKKGPGNISVNTIIKSGSADEPDNLRGISHFIEHLAFDGSKKGLLGKGFRPNEVTRLMEDKGAYINAYTTSGITSFTFNTISKKLKDLAELIKAHATMIKYPSLPPKAFEKEKQVVIQEIKEASGELDTKAYTTTIKNLLGINSTSEEMTLGSEQNIQQMQRKDVLDYHKKNYTPDRMETLVVGDINPEKVIKIIDQYFDTPDFRPSTEERKFAQFTPTAATKISYLTDPNIKHSIATIGFVGPKASDEKASATTAAFLEIIKLRAEESLNEINADFSASFDQIGNNPNNPRPILIDIATTPEKIKSAINAIKNTIKDLKIDPITKEELELAKERILDGFNYQCETGEGISEVFENLASTSGFQTYENIAQLTKSLTLKDLNTAAQKYLNINKASICVVLPENAKNPNISFKGQTQLISTKLVKQITLPNNIRLAIYDNPNTIRTAINFRFESNIQPKPGVIDILTTIIDRFGRAKEDKTISKAKQETAIKTLTCEKGLKSFTMSNSTRPDSLLTTIRAVKSLTLSPYLTPKNFNSAKRDVIELLDYAELTPVEMAEETMYKGSQFGITDRVIKQNIQDVTFEDVKDYFNQLMNDGNLTVSITGPISKTEGLNKGIIDLLSQTPNKFSVKKVLPLEIKTTDKSKLVVQIKNELAQSEILQMFHFQPESIKESAALEVLNQIMGGGMNSRIFADLREKQELAYGISTSVTNDQNLLRHFFSIETGINDTENKLTNNIEKSLSGFDYHQKKIMKQAPSEHEVEVAKKNLLNNITSSTITADQQNEEILISLVRSNKVSYLNQLIKEIEKITPADVKDIAKKCYSKPSVTAIITTPEALKGAEDYLKTKGEIEFM